MYTDIYDSSTIDKQVSTCIFHADIVANGR